MLSRHNIHYKSHIMEAGEPVLAVHALSGNNENLVATAGENGLLGIYDVEKSQRIFEYTFDDAVIGITQPSEYVIYVAQDTAIFKQDIRESPKPIQVFQTPSDINSFDVSGNIIAAATMENNIILSDRRTYSKRKDHPVLPNVCSAICFTESKTLAAGYYDTAIGTWDLTKKTFKKFTKPASSSFNPAVVHYLASKGDYVVAAVQDGINIFKKDKIIVSNSFLHDGAVETISFAPCFPMNAIISGASDGSVMAFDLDNLKPIDCLSVEGEKVQSVSANSKYIAVADTSDNGSIAIFTPDDFSGGEEEE